MTAQLRLIDLPLRRLQAAPELTPFLKWPGGKSQELASIAAAAPEIHGRYIDPFVGGASVLLAVPDDVPAWANDAVRELIELYAAAAAGRSSFRDAATRVAQAWEDLAGLESMYADLVDAVLAISSSQITEIIARYRVQLQGVAGAAGPDLAEMFFGRVARGLHAKSGRIRRVESEVGWRLDRTDLLANIEGSVRSAFYMTIRWRYNRARLAGDWDDDRLVDFLFLREFTYAAMFRFNSRDEFNVPYGGVSYNRKSLHDKLRSLFEPRMIARLQATQWRSQDFESFLVETAPRADDFVFIDPPYDSDFSEYDNRSFGWRDQERLQRVLERCPSKVMVVIKDTPMIRRLYGSDRWRTSEASKTYMWTIKSRNDRSATHLTITNY